MRSIQRVAAAGALLAFMISPSLASSRTTMHHHSAHHHAMHHHHATHHHPCHGMSAGTAHHSCGTQTGGPAGGLH